MTVTDPDPLDVELTKDLRKAVAVFVTMVACLGAAVWWAIDYSRQGEANQQVVQQAVEDAYDVQVLPAPTQPPAQDAIGWLPNRPGMNTRGPVLIASGESGEPDRSAECTVYVGKALDDVRLVCNIDRPRS